MSEYSSVQEPMLKYADQIGWSRVSQEQQLEWRGGEEGLFFRDILREQLLILNPGVVTQDNVDEIIRQLSLIKPTIDGNREALGWLKGEQSVFVASENRERNVRVIDFGSIDDNQFHVTEEWWQKGVAFRNRIDVVFLINGLPVSMCETKAAEKRDALELGITQIRRYHRETPEMFTHAQMFEVTELIRFFYGVSWGVTRKGLFNWKLDAQPGQTDNYEKTIKSFFDRARFLNILQHYIVFLTKEDQLTKVILRQHQTRAVEKVLQRAQEEDKYRGLVWHTQGSGKTLTMITIAARLIREAPGDVKPTVLMLIDRNELEGQLDKNLDAYGIKTYEVAKNKKELRKFLSSDYRGLIVSMIHKFDKLPANINKRDSVVVLVDEAHRTTGGKLGNYLMGALPNATYIGFTGTPIDKISKGEGTFKVFGTDDETGYLDKYSIAESIEDGTTLKLNYSLAPSDLTVDRATLEKEFLLQSDAEGVSDIEELNAILDRAVELKEMMKTDKRVDEIARFVAQHFKENVEPMGFKAFFVCVDREACVLYKKALDKYLPAEYSVPVYSGAHNDNDDLRAFQLSTDQEKDVRKQFIRKNTQPKILIVTEKLLTGFDAPILYAMYLDKPMRDHVLLQTIARVNRPYEDDEGLIKPYGFVLDFVGIFEKLENALAFDSDVVAACIQNIDVLKQLFETMMRERGKDYLPLAQGFDDKAKDKAIEHFAEQKVRDEFFRFYKELQRVFDVLSPDPFLRPWLEDFERLAALYSLIRNAYDPKPYVDRELTEKTRKLLREHTDFSGLSLPGEIHVLGPEELRLIRDAGTSDTTKILNLKKLLRTMIDNDAGSKPFLISIGERAERLAEAYESRQLTTQEALKKYLELAQETVDATEERNDLGVDENTFAIYTVLRAVGAQLDVNQAIEVNDLFLKYPDYLWNTMEKNKLRAELYKALLAIVGKERMIDVANTLLRLQRV